MLIISSVKEAPCVTLKNGRTPMQFNFTESLASQRISELLTRITPTTQQEFFGKWAASNKQDEYYAMDITSVSSYSDFIEFVRWGYNRDGDDLPLKYTGQKMLSRNASMI